MEKIIPPSACELVLEVGSHFGGMNFLHISAGRWDEAGRLDKMFR